MTALPARVGERLAKGAVVARIDDRQYRIDVHGRSAACGDDNRIRLAEAQLAQSESLAAQRFISADALRIRRTDLAVLRSERGANQAALASARLAPGKTVIAPLRWRGAQPHRQRGRSRRGRHAAGHAVRDARYRGAGEGAARATGGAAPRRVVAAGGRRDHRGARHQARLAAGEFGRADARGDLLHRRRCRRPAWPAEVRWESPTPHLPPSFVQQRGDRLAASSMRAAGAVFGSCGGAGRPPGGGRLACGCGSSTPAAAPSVARRSRAVSAYRRLHRQSSARQHHLRAGAAGRAGDLPDLPRPGSGDQLQLGEHHYHLPGASAEDVEQEITSPLEDAIGLPARDVKFVLEQPRVGVLDPGAVPGDPERNFDKRIADLRREVQNKAADELPDDATDPSIVEITTSNGFPTAILALHGPAGGEQLRRAAFDLKKDLEQLPGVDSVIAAGLDDPELHVDFDPAALSARASRRPAVSDTVAAWFRNTLPGWAHPGAGPRMAGAPAGARRPILKPVLAQAAIPVVVAGGPSEVAQVSRAVERTSQLVSYNDQPAIMLSITNRPRPTPGTGRAGSMHWLPSAIRLLASQGLVADHARRPDRRDPATPSASWSPMRCLA